MGRQIKAKVPGKVKASNVRAGLNDSGGIVSMVGSPDFKTHARLKCVSIPLLDLLSGVPGKIELIRVV